MEWLLNSFDPDGSGGLLPPTLAWASGRIADAFDLRSPVRALQLAVAPSNASDAGSSLDSVLAAWLRQRVRQHTMYFCFCGVAAAAWLLVCVSLCLATVVKERRRRRRMRGSNGADCVDAGGAARLKEPPRLSLFAGFVRRRFSRRPAAAARPPFADAVDGFADAAWFGRVHEASSKALRHRDCGVRSLTAASLLALVVCAALLSVSLWQAAAFASVTAGSGGAGGVRAMAARTLGHVDTFLHRSLVEANATVISIFQSAQPKVQRLFLQFGQNLLDSLMADFSISLLIKELQGFLQRVNEIIVAMQQVMAAREATIQPLYTFADRVEEKAATLRRVLASLCRRRAHPACSSATSRLGRLVVPVNHTRLNTDTSVTVVTLMDKMLNLNIGDVQRKVEAAQAALGESLEAISLAVKSLFDNLVGEVSRQFAQAGSVVAEAKSRYEAAAADPRLWAAVAVGHNGVVALLVVAGVVLAGACIGGACLLAAVLRHIRIGRRLDREAARRRDDNNNRCLQLKRQDAVKWQQPASAATLRERLVEKEVNSFVFCCATQCSLLLLLLATLAALPLLLSFAAFYTSAELHVEACRYLATERGVRQWDSQLDAFLRRNVWPKVSTALASQDAVAISIDEFPQRLLHAAGTECAQPHRTLFQIFRLQHVVNATRILNANSTLQQFGMGAQMIRDQINATDIGQLLPPELQLLKPALPQVAGVVDRQDYSESVRELQKPLLLLQQPELGQLLADCGAVAEAALAADGTDQDAIILLHTLRELSTTLLKAPGIARGLQQLRENFLKLQDRRDIGQLVVRLLAALAGVEAVVADKEQMLRQVDRRYYEMLRRHLPKFVEFLDPLAVRLFGSVGHCDDIARAFHVVADDFCAGAVPRVATAALLLCVTVFTFGAFFTFCWLLLLRVRRHQAAAFEFQLLRLPLPDAAAAAAAAAAAHEPIANRVSVC